MKMQSLVFNWKRCLGALLTTLVLVLLACEELPRYICSNGTAMEGTTGTTGQNRCISCNPLYRLSGPSGAMGTTCEQVAVGEATPIANVDQFGVNEGDPYGLAAIGNILYMVGAGTDRLYTINIDDGTAIRVGAAARGFGVGESLPTGLAAIGATLYMVGQSNNKLYTLNLDSTDMTPDGSAIQVGSLAAGFGVGESFSAGLAAISDILYMVGQFTGYLSTLDTADGTATRVGSVAAGFGVNERNPHDLAAIGSTLYMVGSVNDRLYTINIDDGRARRVGLANQFGASEDHPRGLAAIGDTLYMVGADEDVLYVVRYQ